MKYSETKIEGKYKEELTTMGDAMKRRDNAPIVKEIYSGLLDMLFTKYDVNTNISKTKIIKYYKEQIEKVLNGEYDIKQFIITVTLKSSYKNPESIQHKVLADRITERDPGNAPESNDRMAFVYVEKIDKLTKEIMVGDTVETPEYIIENNLQINYLHYVTNQIHKPSASLLELFMDESETDNVIKHLILLESKKQEIKRRKCINKLNGYKEISEFVI